MKKIISLIIILIIGFCCYGLDYSITYDRNIERDDYVKYQVGFNAIKLGAELSKDKGDYSFEKLDGQNMGVYFMAQECKSQICSDYDVKNGDLYSCVYDLNNEGYIIIYVYKRYDTEIEWEYYAYCLVLKGENNEK